MTPPLTHMIGEPALLNLFRDTWKNFRYQKMTCLDGIGGGAGEGDEVYGVRPVSSLTVKSGTRTKLPGSRGEREMGRGLVQPKCQ